MKRIVFLLSLTMISEGALALGLGFGSNQNLINQVQQMRQQQINQIQQNQNQNQQANVNQEAQPTGGMKGIINRIHEKQLQGQQGQQGQQELQGPGRFGRGRFGRFGNQNQQGGQENLQQGAEGGPMLGRFGNRNRMRPGLQGNPQEKLQGRLGGRYNKFNQNGSDQSNPGNQNVGQEQQGEQAIFVHYGANGKFKSQKFAFGSSLNCGNGTFGDPIDGVVKACYIGSNLIAKEGDTINLNSPKYLLYGGEPPQGQQAQGPSPASNGDGAGRCVKKGGGNNLLSMQISCEGKPKAICIALPLACRWE